MWFTQTEGCEIVIVNGLPQCKKITVSPEALHFWDKIVPKSVLEYSFLVVLINSTINMSPCSKYFLGILEWKKKMHFHVC